MKSAAWRWDGRDRPGPRDLTPMSGRASLLLTLLLSLAIWAGIWCATWQLSLMTLPAWPPHLPLVN